MFHLPQIGLNSVLHQQRGEEFDLPRLIFTRPYENGSGNLPAIVHHYQVFFDFVFWYARQRKLRCRPADRAYGYLNTTTRAGSDELDGHFLVELATCENTETGRVIEWPPAPLTIRGSFENLPHGLNRDKGVNSPLD